MASLAMGEGFANDGYFYDWGGGQIWLAAPQASPAATAAAVRALVTPTAGHATLVRAPKQTRESISAFHPQVKSLAALAEQLRKSLDPAGIFNPARLA
jgi:glycolate oxidase FAD binding subunit